MGKKAALLRLAAGFLMATSLPALTTPAVAQDFEAPIIGSWILATDIRLVGQPRKFFIASELDPRDQGAPWVSIQCALGKYSLGLIDVRNEKAAWQGPVSLKVDDKVDLMLQAKAEGPSDFGLDLEASLSPENVAALSRARETIAVAGAGENLTFPAHGTDPAMRALGAACETSKP